MSWVLHLILVTLQSLIHLVVNWEVVTARRHAKRSIYRRRVCVCVCLSHSGTVSKRLNVGPHK